MSCRIGVEIEQLEFGLIGANCARILGLDQVVQPVAAQFGQNFDRPPRDLGQHISGTHADLQIGPIRSASNDQRSRALQPGQLQHAGLAGIAFQHRDAAPFAGRGIGRADVQRDHHDRHMLVTKTFHDLASRITQPAHDGVVFQTAGEQYAGIAADILQHQLEHADKGQRRHDDLRDKERPMNPVERKIAHRLD
jgi:hypothetical protein